MGYNSITIIAKMVLFNKIIWKNGPKICIIYGNNTPSTIYLLDFWPSYHVGNVVHIKSNQEAFIYILLVFLKSNLNFNHEKKLWESKYNCHKLITKDKIVTKEGDNFFLLLLKFLKLSLFLFNHILELPLFLSIKSLNFKPSI